MGVFAAKPLQWQNLREHIVHFPVDNPRQMTLKGTNCFIIGKGHERTIVDPGDYPENNQSFLTNFSEYLAQNKDFNIKRILITHGHADHFGGVQDTIELLEQQKRATQDLTAYKLLTDNKHEQDVFEKFPKLKERVQTITDRQKFDVGDPSMTIEAIYTPGHLDDHVSFSITEQESSEKVLICGDIILGTPSTSVQDFSEYIKSLKLLQEMNFDQILLPHSLSWEPEAVMVEGKPKINAYIKYREVRLVEMLDAFTSTGGEECVTKTREELYSKLYGNKGLTGMIQMSAYYNLDQQIKYLIEKGLMKEEETAVYSRITDADMPPL